jgi:hypothetical protein
MIYAQVKRGQRLHIAYEVGEGKDDASIVRAGYISAPLCGRTLPPEGYRMTINMPLRNACQACSRVWRVRHGA